MLQFGFHCLLAKGYIMITNQHSTIRRLIYSSAQIQSLNKLDLNKLDLNKALTTRYKSMKSENDYLKDPEENEVFILGYN